MPAPVQFDAPSALEFFSVLVADDGSLPLLEAAVAVAQYELPELDVQGELDRIDTLSHRLRQRVPADAAPLQRLRLLNQYFFQELGFAGNVNDYHDPANSLLPRVLDTRRGIPISLALLYLEMAAQAGLQAEGVSFPGHYLVKLSLPRGEVVIDPFDGRSLTREELEERLLPFRSQRLGLAGELPLALFLQAAAPRETLARMLRNLVQIHRRNHDLPRLAAVLRRVVVVQPQSRDERRELCTTLAQLGRHREAQDELEAYGRQHPSAPDAQALAADLARWRRAH